MSDINFSFFVIIFFTGRTFWLNEYGVKIELAFLAIPLCISRSLTASSSIINRPKKLTQLRLSFSKEHSHCYLSFIVFWLGNSQCPYRAIYKYVGLLHCSNHHLAILYQGILYCSFQTDVSCTSLDARQHRT